ncbi:MAG: aminoacyl-tRNA hydrolase [Deltaproteobacteria bacterium]|nr:aminoacyl-tRNA hydrolase [Deltaproteobacteria bacterium]MBZ0219696.1 aminoacyl-tRNA hydrolase [Deltaproteobacteria bacterium]
MIKVTDRIWLHEGELSWEFVRAGGPGGQHVNKASTAVQLRFNVDSSSLPQDVKDRLRSIAGHRLTAGGDVVIEARESRSQERNRNEALQKLTELLSRAAEKPRRRRKTKPTAASKERRLKAKAVRGAKKKMRRKGGEE